MKSSTGIMKVLKKSFQEDNIEYVLKSYLVGFVSDGASVMMGARNGLKVKMEEYLGRTILGVHCHAHRIQLAVGRAFKDVEEMKALERVANDLYVFYFSFSHKRKAHLEEFTNTEHFRLNYIFDVRWVSSEFQSIERIIKFYPDLAKDLKENL